MAFSAGCGLRRRVRADVCFYPGAAGGAAIARRRAGSKHPGQWRFSGESLHALCGFGYSGVAATNAVTAPNPIQFQNIALTSSDKVINDTLYVTVKSSESVNLYPAGIYSFVDFIAAGAR